MEAGPKNLASLARSSHRDRKLQQDAAAHHSHHQNQLHTPVLPYNNAANRNSVGSYGDDSGISGIGYDDNNNGYSPNSGDAGFRSSGEYVTNEQMRGDDSWRQLQSNLMHPHQAQPSYARMEQQRYSLPAGVGSTDMRIPALINGPGHGLNGMNNGMNGHDNGMNRRDPGNGMNGHGLNGRS